MELPLSPGLTYVKKVIRTIKYTLMALHRKIFTTQLGMGSMVSNLSHCQLNLLIKLVSLGRKRGDRWPWHTPRLHIMGRISRKANFDPNYYQNPTVGSPKSRCSSKCLISFRRHTLHPAVDTCDHSNHYQVTKPSPSPHNLAVAGDMPEFEALQLVFCDAIFEER